MRVAILGATGKLGEQLVLQALGAGFEVSALARDPSKLRRANENFTVYKGDAFTGEGLEVALEGCDFVISAMGSPRPVMARCIHNLMQKLELSPPKRFVFVSWVGAGDSRAQAELDSGLLGLFRRLSRRRMFEDISQAESIIRVSHVPYVILRPTRLTQGAPTHNVVSVDAREARPGPMSRADLARFTLGLLGEAGWNRREVTLGSSLQSPAHY